MLLSKEECVASGVEIGLNAIQKWLVALKVLPRREVLVMRQHFSPSQTPSTGFDVAWNGLTFGERVHFFRLQVFELERKDFGCSLPG